MNKQFKIVLLVCSVCLLSACTKDADPVPASETPRLEDIIAGNYWSESIHFMSYNKGYRPKIEESDEDIISGFDLMGGHARADQTTLDKIYVEKDTRKVWRYMKDKYGGYVGHYRNSYTIRYDDVNQCIRILSPFDSLAFMNAVAGSEMQVVKILEDEIVFDAPLKPFIEDNWLLNRFNSEREYVGIRIHWTKTDPNALQHSKPLD